MKNFLISCTAILVFTLTFPLSAGALEKSSGRVEGEGFATPDEAILAFAEALKEGDLDRMVSTFAVESYCERYDSARSIQRLKAIQPYTLFDYYAPVSGTSNDVMDQYNKEGRRADIIRQIKRPLLMISLDRLEMDHPEYAEIAAGLKQMKAVYGDIVDAMSHDDLKELISEIQSLPDFSDMTVSAPMTPVTFYFLTDHYFDEMTLSNIMRQALIAGADGVTERGLILENGKETYLISMNIIRYGDRWYNCTTGGAIMAIMGVESYRQGLIGGRNDALRVDNYDLNGIVRTLKTPESELIARLVPELQAVKEDFDERHEELSKEILAEAGDRIDPERPLIEQIYDLIGIVESEGENWYQSDVTQVIVMSFDEMLEYFAMENLAEAMS